MVMNKNMKAESYEYIGTFKIYFNIYFKYIEIFEIYIFKITFFFLIVCINRGCLKLWIRSNKHQKNSYDSMNLVVHKLQGWRRKWIYLLINNIFN